MSEVEVLEMKLEALEERLTRLELAVDGLIEAQAKALNAIAILGEKVFGD